MRHKVKIEKMGSNKGSSEWVFNKKNRKWNKEESDESFYQQKSND